MMMMMMMMTQVEVQDGMHWDAMEQDQIMGWDRQGSDGMGQTGIRWDGRDRDQMGWDRQGSDGMEQTGIRWDGTDRDQMGWERMRQLRKK